MHQLLRVTWRVVAITTTLDAGGLNRKALVNTWAQTTSAPCLILLYIDSFLVRLQQHVAFSLQQ